MTNRPIDGLETPGRNSQHHHPSLGFQMQRSVRSKLLSLLVGQALCFRFCTALGCVNVTLVPIRDEVPHGPRKVYADMDPGLQSPSNSAVASANDNAPGLETIVLSNPRLLAESLPPLSSMCRSEDSRAYIR